MADTTKIQFYLDNEALDIINKAATDRRRGEWVSKAVIEYSRIMALSPADDECGTLEQIAGRLQRIEQRLTLADSKIDILLGGKI